mgnify:CR=1 FL=1
MSGSRGPPVFTYNKSWEQIEKKLYQLEREQKEHLDNAIRARKNGKKKDAMYFVRQYKALEGAIVALRWTLGDRRADPSKGMDE